MAETRRPPSKSDRAEAAERVRPTAAVLSSDEYESTVETLNILGDQDSMAAIAQGEAEFATGELVRLDEI